MNQCRRVKGWFEYDSVPANILSESTKVILHHDLNSPSPVINQEKLPCDWRGMAKLMGFNEQAIRELQGSRNPAAVILECWIQESTSCIALLLRYIEKLERPDILLDIKERLEADIKRYKDQNSIPSSILPVSCEECVAVGDVPGQLQYYDAFISYCDEDYKFIRKMIKHLEERLSLKLLIPERDMLAGGAKYEVTAQLIEQRCQRTVIVLSPDYILSEQCQFEIRYATALTSDAGKKKIVPILYKKCQIPHTLHFLTLLDYTKTAFQNCFWDRLYKTLSSPLLGDSSTNSQSDLSSISFMANRRNAIRRKTQSSLNGLSSSMSSSSSSELEASMSSQGSKS